MSVRRRRVARGWLTATDWLYSPPETTAASPPPAAAARHARHLSTTPPPPLFYSIQLVFCVAEKETLPPPPPPMPLRRTRFALDRVRRGLRHIWPICAHKKGTTGCAIMQAACSLSPMGVLGFFVVYAGCWGCVSGKKSLICLIRHD
jgi:hypothetical protein